MKTENSIAVGILIATSLGDVYELVSKMIEFINNEILSKSDNVVLEINNLEFETSLSTGTSSFDLSNINIGVLSDELDKKTLDFSRDDIIDSKTFRKVEQDVSSKRLELEYKLADIADFYAWAALFFSKRHDYRRVTVNLKKAIALNSNYEKILLTEKLNRTSDKKEIYKNILEVEKASFDKKKSVDRIDALDKIIDLQEKVDASDYNEVLFYCKKMISVIRGYKGSDNYNEKLAFYASKAKDLIDRQYFGDDRLEERSYKLAELYDELGLNGESYYYYYLLTEILRNRGDSSSDRFVFANQKIKEIFLNSNSGLTPLQIVELNEKAQGEISKIINSAGGIEQWNAYHEVKEIRGLVSRIESLIQSDTKASVLHNVVEKGFKSQLDNISILEDAMGSLKDSLSSKLNDVEAFLTANKANHNSETTSLVKLIKEDFSSKINSMEEKLSSGLNNNNQGDFVNNLKHEFDLFGRVVDEKLSALSSLEGQVNIDKTPRIAIFPWVVAGLSMLLTLIVGVLYLNGR